MTTRNDRPPRRRVLSTALVGLAVGLILIAIEVKAGAQISGAIGGVAIIVAYVAFLLVFQSRSETVGTLAGNPADERWGLIHGRAMEASATIGAIVALIGFAILEAMGRDGWQFGLIAGVMGLVYIIGVIWYRRVL